MANRPERSQEQQDFRDNLAHYIMTLREYGCTGKKLAKIFLYKEQLTTDYKISMRKKFKQEEKLKNLLFKAIDKGDLDSVRKIVDEAGDKELGYEIADKLSEAGYIEIVKEKGQKFKRLGITTYCKLKDTMEGSTVPNINFIVNSMDKFEDHNYIVNDYVNNGFLYWNHNILKLCRGLNKETFKNLLDHEGGFLIEMIWRIQKNVFIGLDDECFVEMVKCVSYRNVKYLKDVMKCFSGLNKESFLYIREKYEACNDDFNDSDRCILKDAILDNIEIFDGLDEEIAEKLINDGFGRIVAKNPEKFGLKKEK